MHRHRRRRQARRPRNAPARTGLLAAAFGVVVVLIAVWSSTIAPDVRPGMTPDREAVDPAVLVVGGILRLRTDAPPAPHVSVAYLIDGPESLIRFAPRPPYRVDLDTRLLPDGAYTIDEVIFRSASVPRVRVKTTRVRIHNAGSLVWPRPGTAPAHPRPRPSAPSAANTVPAPAATTPSARPSAPAAASPASVASPAASAAHPAASPTTPPTRHPATRSATPPTPSAGTVTAEALEAQIVELTNEVRKGVGCAPLLVDERLTAAAREHSADMKAGDYFGHDSPDGRTPFQRIAAAGFTFSVAAENIAAGQRTPRDVMTGWRNSPAHWAIIVNCSLTHVGVGFARGGSYGTYWTQDFGTP